MTGVMMEGNGSKESRRVSIAGSDGRDLADMSAMLRRCSREALYHRFHGFSDGMDYLHRQLDPERDLLRMARVEDRCVGFAVVSPHGDGSWHLGVLVEDQWQRRGVGTALVMAVVTQASRWGITRLRAQVLAEDRYLIELLRRVGPLSGVCEGTEILVDVQVRVQAP